MDDPSVEPRDTRRAIVMGGSVVPSGDGQADFSFYLDGHRMAAGKSGLRGYGVTRPLIEAMIRDRVAKLPNVEIVDKTEAVGLHVTDAQTRGVELRHRRSPVDSLRPTDSG
jgi:2-polyprenyl-6-methoxyphenol hydroxylase-like FAD-dependent oxidoreductase